MNNEIESRERDTEISYPFDKPNNVFYVTQVSWKLNEVNLITEDHRFVMGPSYSDSDYIPLPLEIFRESIENLAKRKALQIKPSMLYESIDFDRLEASGNDAELTYILDSNGVLIRIRNDSEGVHTMKMFGRKESLVEICKEISLPNPFDKKSYPYRENFRDVSGANGKIIFLE